MSLSVPSVAEYEAVAKRMLDQIPSTEKQVDDILDYLCSAAHHQMIFFLWCPFLIDPMDDMILEVSVAAGCEYLITYNPKHFRGVEKFGIKITAHHEFLIEIGGYDDQRKG